MFYLYILHCGDNSLYTGITNDIEQRLQKHRSGKGAKYVRAHLPFELIYQEEFATKSEAMQREFAIKTWSRSKKISVLKLSSV